VTSISSLRYDSDTLETEYPLKQQAYKSSSTKYRKIGQVDVFALMSEHRRVSPNICDNAFTWSMDSDTIYENMITRYSNIFEIDKNTGKHIQKLRQTSV